jgi:hypothetical protein
MRKRNIVLIAVVLVALVPQVLSPPETLAAHNTASSPWHSTAAFRI